MNPPRGENIHSYYSKKKTASEREPGISSIVVLSLSLSLSNHLLSGRQMIVGIIIVHLPLTSYTYKFIKVMKYSLDDSIFIKHYLNSTGRLCPRSVSYAVSYD